MEQLNQQISDKVSPPPFSSKQMCIFLLLVAMLSGIGGYLIGAEMSKNTNNQVTSRPTPLSQVPPITPPSSITIQSPSIPFPTNIGRASSPAGWQVYTSQEFSYSLAYPASWKIYVATSSAPKREFPWNDVILHFHGPSETYFDNNLRDGIQLYVWLFPNDKHLLLSEWIHQWDIQEKITPRKTEWVTKQGVWGIRSEEDCIVCEASATYYFPLRNMIVSLSIHAENSDDYVRKYYQAVAERVYEFFQLQPGIH